MCRICMSSPTTYAYCNQPLSSLNMLLGHTNDPWLICPIRWSYYAHTNHCPTLSVFLSTPIENIQTMATIIRTARPLLNNTSLSFGFPLLVYFLVLSLCF